MAFPDSTFTVVQDSTSNAITAGATLVCPAWDGTGYVVATDANVLHAGGVMTGLATSSIAAANGGSFTVQCDGTVANATTNLGVGVACFAVRDTNGTIRRKLAPVQGDSVVGWVNAAGDVTLDPTKFLKPSQGGGAYALGPGAVTVPSGTYLAFDPANIIGTMSTGVIRWPTTCAGIRAGTNVDANVISVTNNALRIGDASATNGVTIEGGAGLTINVSAVFLAVGGQPVASVGDLRLRNTGAIEARNATNDGDVPLLKANASNQAEIGAPLALTNQTIAASATAGANGATPAQVAGYLVVPGINGTSYKIALYNT